MKDITHLSDDLRVPVDAVSRTSGEDRYTAIGTDVDGNVGYFPYVDDVRRVQVFVERGEDGTYRVADFMTRLGV